MGNSLSYAGVWPLPPKMTTSKRGITESIMATHEFKVTNYRYRALDGKLGLDNYVSSGTFSVGGCDWKIRFCPDGSAKHGFASVYLACLSCPPAENVSTKFALTVLTTKRGKVASLDNVRRTFTPTSPCWGLPDFVEKSKLESQDDDDDGYITIRCDLTVAKEPPLTGCNADLIEVPPPELPGHLERALEEEKGADVTFHVGGREFRANMFMLASRSPVFDALLFGPMAEKDMGRVEVVDMEPAIFEMLLHFICTDSLPPPTCDDDDIEEGGYDTAEMQHLLVAADRYGLDRLKVLCEEKLYRGLEVETVMSTLALADRHCCPRLKDACVAFMSQSDVMGAVTRNDGFKHLIGRCPMLALKEESK